VILARTSWGEEEIAGPAEWMRQPRVSGATAPAGRMRNELYNDGKPFKITCRTLDGVMAPSWPTTIRVQQKRDKDADQLFCEPVRHAEEEHAGGALAFPSYRPGLAVQVRPAIIEEGYTFDEALKTLGRFGHAVRRRLCDRQEVPEHPYVPQDVQIDLPTLSVTWTKDGKPQRIKLLPDKIYILPFRIQDPA